ncbi:MAG: class I SAM-dependent methyltransferase [Oscillospiraceae bacterium]|nr:class I SAM-dependent methyltransferase [Oscillospiraceae bacterium]
MMDSYTVLAQFYDELTTDVPYERWADYLEKQFARHKRPIRTVTELGCGTGTLAAILARRGYEVTAVDLSPEMLCVAAEKCAGLDVQLVCQDMSRLALPEPADAVICCLDSLNYVTRPAAVRRTFQRVFDALKPGGLFLFDVKTPLALESADAQTYLDENEDLFCVWRGSYDKRRRICCYGIDLFVLQEDGSWCRDGEYHEEYAYTMEELSLWLGEAGFTKIKQFGELRLSPPKAEEMRIFFTAGKE